VTYRFFGLDGEMSSSDLDRGGRLIQIGVTAHANEDGTLTPGVEAFCMLLNPGPNHRELVADAVHGFTEDDIANAEPAAKVDGFLVDWLLAHGAHPKRRGRTIPVGFNVGAFDMPHVARVLPRASALFSRRTLDLNAVCFNLDGARFEGAAVDADGWKEMSQTYAKRTIAALGAAGDAHDAGYDSLVHLHAWRFLRSVSHGEPLPFPSNDVPQPRSQMMARSVIAGLGVDAAVASSGIPREFIVQWSRGGRATNKVYLDALQTLYVSAQCA
jgi:hypothetical protein